MGHRNREIETKLEIRGRTYESVCLLLNALLADEKPIIRVGSSVDTYWPVHDPNAPAQFLRVRERDGIRQITVKGKDRDTNTNRIEIDIDSTSEVFKIHRLIRTILGKPAGIVCKTYRVWELESEYDTVCAYEVTTPSYPHVIVEVEARSEERMQQLLVSVRRALPSATETGWSLYEKFIEYPTQMEK